MMAAKKHGKPKIRAAQEGAEALGQGLPFEGPEHGGAVNLVARPDLCRNICCPHFRGPGMGSGLLVSPAVWFWSRTELSSDCGSLPLRAGKTLCLSEPLVPPP